MRNVEQEFNAVLEVMIRYQEEREAVERNLWRRIRTLEKKEKMSREKRPEGDGEVKEGNGEVNDDDEVKEGDGEVKDVDEDKEKDGEVNEETEKLSRGKSFSALFFKRYLQVNRTSFPNVSTTARSIDGLQSNDPRVCGTD